MSETTLTVSEDNEADILAAAEAAKAEAAGTTLPKEEAKVEDVKVEEGKPEDEVKASKEGETKLTVTKEETAKAEEAVDDALDLDAYYAEFVEKGGLSEESTAKIVGVLTKAKIANPEAVLAQYMAGAKSQVAQMQATAFEVTGDAETYVEMKAWASENLTPAQIVAFDMAVEDPNMVGIAVTGLFAQFQKATGKQTAATTETATVESRRVQAGITAHMGHAPLNSQEQLSQLVSDPKYKSDPGFRKTADARIRASMDAGLI